MVHIQKKRRRMAPPSTTTTTTPQPRAFVRSHAMMFSWFPLPSVARHPLALSAPLSFKQPFTFWAMNSGSFKNRSVQFIKKNKPKTLPPRRILEKQARKARGSFASCSREFSDLMTCYNKVGATKMSCYTEILKLSRCLDSEQAQGKTNKSTIPFHINRLYKDK